MQYILLCNIRLDFSFINITRSTRWGCSIEWFSVDITVNKCAGVNVKWDVVYVRHIYLFFFSFSWNCCFFQNAKRGNICVCMCVCVRATTTACWFDHIHVHSSQSVHLLMCIQYSVHRNSRLYIMFVLYVRAWTPSFDLRKFSSRTYVAMEKLCYCCCYCYCLSSHLETNFCTYGTVQHTCICTCHWR